MRGTREQRPKCWFEDFSWLHILEKKFWKFWPRSEHMSQLQSLQVKFKPTLQQMEHKNWPCAWNEPTKWKSREICALWTKDSTEHSISRSQGRDLTSRRCYTLLLQWRLWEKDKHILRGYHEKLSLVRTERKQKVRHTDFKGTPSRNGEVLFNTMK